MTLKQIFGWTQIEKPLPNKWVRFIAVSENDDPEKDEINFSIRGDDCVFKTLTLPGNDALDLAFKIILSRRNRDRVESGLPPLTSLLSEMTT